MKFQSGRESFKGEKIKINGNLHDNARYVLVFMIRM